MTCTTTVQYELVHCTLYSIVRNLESFLFRELKLHYAFSIYDIDGDGYVGVNDIQQVCTVGVKDI